MRALYESVLSPAYAVQHPQLRPLVHRQQGVVVSRSVMQNGACMHASSWSLTEHASRLKLELRSGVMLCFADFSCIISCHYRRL
jgi:hypothetical protein